MPRLKAILESRGYSTGQINDKKWLQESLFRADLGLMSYVPYSNDELKELIKARNIPAKLDESGKARGKRTDLVFLLDVHDQKPDFHRFLELPAELRNRIYAMHFESLGEPQHPPSQPPLTLTSRQLRSEALPMFYSWLRLPIQLSRRSGSPILAMSATRMSIYCPDKLELFFRNTLPENLALIRHFRFSVIHEAGLRGSRSPIIATLDATMTFEIDLPEDLSGPPRLRFAQVTWNNCFVLVHILTRAWRLRARIQAWSNRLRDEKGRLDLDMGDVVEVSKTIEGVLGGYET